MRSMGRPVLRRGLLHTHSRAIAAKERGSNGSIAMYGSGVSAFAPVAYGEDGKTSVDDGQSSESRNAFCSSFASLRFR